MVENLLNTTTLVTLAAVFAAGLALGAFYFVALWQTIRRLPAAKSPALLMFGSFMLRVAVVMAGFYFIIRIGHWELLVSALMGFILMKIILTRRLGLNKAN